MRALSLATLIFVASLTNAQFDPSMYAASHLLSTVQGPSSEEAGRGGSGVAVNHPWGGNPAHALPSTSVLGMHQFTSFEGGIDIALTSIKMAFPLGKKSGMMVNLAKQRSKVGMLGDSGLALQMEAENLTISASHRCNDQLTVGIAVAPVMETNTFITAGNQTFAAIESDEDLGARLGLQLSLGNCTVGYTYDWYREDVSIRKGNVVTSSNYISKVSRVGAAKRCGDILFACDYIHGKSDGIGQSSFSGWLYGIDIKASENTTLRLGSWSGKPTLGLSSCSNRSTIHVGYASDIWDEQFRPIIGGHSDTWSISASHSW